MNNCCGADLKVCAGPPGPAPQHRPAWTPAAGLDSCPTIKEKGLNVSTISTRRHSFGDEHTGRPVHLDLRARPPAASPPVDDRLGLDRRPLRRHAAVQLQPDPIAAGGLVGLLLPGRRRLRLLSFGLPDTRHTSGPCPVLGDRKSVV